MRGLGFGEEVGKLGGWGQVGRVSRGRFWGSKILKISKKQKRVILKKCVFAGQNLVPRRQNRIETDSTI